MLHLYGTHGDTKIRKKYSGMEVSVAEGRWVGQKGNSEHNLPGMNVYQDDHKCEGRINTLHNTHRYYEGL